MGRTGIGGMAAALILAAAGAAVAGEVTEGASYDLLFKGGTLDALPRDRELGYARTVTNSLRPDMAAEQSGEIRLGFSGGSPEEVALALWQGDRHRNVGSFPASVGNPVIMYFIETVVRDMATSTGGSQFYIRNRVKEALVRPGEVESVTLDRNGQAVPARVVTLHPFAGDPNTARMQGFGDLAIRVTMSDAVPGWYDSLEAEASSVYRSAMRLEPEAGDKP